MGVNSPLQKWLSRAWQLNVEIDKEELSTLSESKASKALVDPSLMSKARPNWAYSLPY